MIEEIVTAWQVNNRVHLRIIDKIDGKGMACTLSQRGGRNVSRQFAHVHNNRIWHLQKRAPALAKGARLFATEEEPDRRTLKAALTDSARRIEDFFRGIDARNPGVRGLKRGLVTYLAYFVAHESHHRGSVLLTLKQCGHALEKATRDGIWDWNRI